MRLLASASLGRRIILSVILGLGLILSIFGLVSHWTVSEMVQASYQERLVFARIVAARFDDVLRYSGSQVTQTSTALVIDAEQGLSDSQRALLRDLSQQLGLFAAVNLIERSGAVLWADSQHELLVGRNVADHPCVPPALLSSAAIFGQIPGASEEERTHACLGVPVKDRQGSVAGVLVADLDPGHASLNLLPVTLIEQDSSIALVDANGITVVASAGHVRKGDKPHRTLLAPFFDEGRPGVVLHKADPGGAFPDHIVAFAPISTLPGWGVIVEQPKDVTLAAASGLQARLIAAGVLAVLAAVVVASLAGRRITMPLKRLTSAAERFAEGNLDEAIDVTRGDEVGMLARAFETMRRRLKRSLEEIEGYSRHLEERVRDRTLEIEQRNRQLAAMNDIATTVSSSLKSGEILGRALERVVEVARSEQVRFRLNDGGLLARAEGEPGRRSFSTIGDACDSACLCFRALHLGLPLVSNDLALESKALDCQRAGLKSAIAVPLSAQKRILGVMLLASNSYRQYDQADIETLTAIGRQIGLALANAKLYEELQERERVRGRLIEQIIRAQEGERKRIARDLHDSTAQTLYAIMMGIDESEEVGQHDHPSLVDNLRRTRRLAEDAMRELRDLVLDLRPPALDDLGLVPAIRAYAVEHLESKGTAVTVKAMGMDDRLPAQLETTLFRVLQEAITNVAKHARASTVTIELERTASRLCAEVVDDGVGCDAAAINNRGGAGKGLGMLGIWERMEMLGGSMHLTSAPDAGTRMSIELPIREAHEGE